MLLNIFLLAWLVACFVIFFSSKSLLLTLISLEVTTFMVLFCFCFSMNYSVFSDHFLLSVFSLFVMEGVIGLTGLIILVAYSGSDYLSTSSLLQ